MFEYRKPSGRTSVSDDGLLVLECAPDADPDIVADAFVAFAVSRFGQAGAKDIPIEEIFSWQEISPDAFQEACAQCQSQIDVAPLLQGIWAQNRLAVIASPWDLSKEEWDELIEDLTESDLDADDDTVWRVIKHPLTTAADINVPAKPDPAPAPAQIVRSLPSTPFHASITAHDRSKPVRATPEQMTALNLATLQEQGAHPVVAMPPVFLDSADSQALWAAFEALQERHEILHMSFVLFGSETFMCVTDTAEVPYLETRPFRPFQSLQNIVDEVTSDLVRKVKTPGPLWQAATVRKGQKAAVTCVFSETIADQKTADLFREELIAFYEAYKEGKNPETALAAPALQYIDHAATARDASAALAWWDRLLPLERTASKDSSRPKVAPVRNWAQALPDQLIETLTQVSTTEDVAQSTIYLHAFLRCLKKLENKVPDWITMRLSDTRPEGHENMLGQFSRHCPFWLSDLPDDETTKDLENRLSAVRSQSALTVDDLTETMANRLPQRIPHFFDYSSSRVYTHHLAAPHDIALRVVNTEAGLTAYWAVREDHHLILKQRVVLNTFRKELDRLGSKK